MFWFLGFVFTFTLGGMTGVLLAIPPADFQLHNSLFLVAHFHNTIIGGVVFGYLAGFVYWFPKFMGFRLNEWLGKSAFFCWIVGFALAFIPLYVLGLMGYTRRLNHFDEAPGVEALLIVAAIGATIIVIGVVLQVVQVIASIAERKRLKDKTGDPWDGRTLEWSTSSPPPHYNFAVIPNVHERDAFFAMKEAGAREHVKYHDIQMPKNTATGLIIAFFAFAGGFALVWHIDWLIVAALIGIVAAIIVRSFATNVSYIIPASEIERNELGHSHHLAKHAT
jgi:cytochrome o ubiquinol oxidase subunit I